MELVTAKQFFSDWLRLREQIDPGPQLKAFFADWLELSASDSSTKQTSALDCDQFRVFSQAFASAYASHRQYGGMANVWRAAGLGHDELRNSRVLAWMLSRHEDHGQGSSILEALVKLAAAKRPDLVDSALSNLVRTTDYRTRVESLPLGDYESRVDIEIESPLFLIFIEVKIRAGETNDQLKRYRDISRRKLSGGARLILFLTPSGKLPTDPSLHSDIIPIPWSEVARILAHHVRGAVAESFSGHAFRQFAEHIRDLR